MGLRALPIAHDGEDEGLVPRVSLRVGLWAEAFDFARVVAADPGGKFHAPKIESSDHVAIALSAHAREPTTFCPCGSLWISVENVPEKWADPAPVAELLPSLDFLRPPSYDAALQLRVRI
jgi:hypothetical protein